jgi:hypothetical protein
LNDFKGGGGIESESDLSDSEDMPDPVTMNNQRNLSHQ